MMKATATKYARDRIVLALDCDDASVIVKMTIMDAEHLVLSVTQMLAAQQPSRWTRFFDNVRDVLRGPQVSGAGH